MNTRNVILVALALVGATALGADCGLANPFAPAASTSGQDQLLRWAQCMRQHGVDIPDPVNGRIPNTTTPAPGQSPSTKAPIDSDPQFQAAQTACKQYAPNGGVGSTRPSQQQLDLATKYAQCMRDHGIPVQDPQVQPNGGILIQGGGSGIDPNSAQYEQARQACAKYRSSTGGTAGGAG